MDLLRSGGPVLIIIILVSLYALYVFLERLFKLNKERVEADTLMSRVNAAVRERDLELALAACESHGGPVARVLHAALLRLPYGRAAVEAAFTEASLREEQNLGKGLRLLSTISQIGPLLGLLGTVSGMIAAFVVISHQGTGDPLALASGIGEALVDTAAGLILAIPALVGYNYLANRVDNMMLEIDRRREELMGNIVEVVSHRRENRPASTPAEPEGSYEGYAPLKTS